MSAESMKSKKIKSLRIGARAELTLLKSLFKQTLISFCVFSDPIFAERACLEREWKHTKELGPKQRRLTSRHAPIVDKLDFPHLQFTGIKDTRRRKVGLRRQLPPEAYLHFSGLE